MAFLHEIFNNPFAKKTLAAVIYLPFMNDFSAIDLLDRIKSQCQIDSSF